MNTWPEAPLKQTSDTQQLRSNLFVHGDAVIRATREFGADASSGYSDSRPHVEGLRTAKQLFKELADDFGVEHAGFMPIVGKVNDQGIGEYVVSAKIAGESCVDPSIQPIPEHQIPATRELLEKLTNYIQAKHQSNTPILTDVFKLEQYIYVPERNTMVLVDTDPYFDQELGGVFAYKGMQPIAQQVLGPEAYEIWDKQLSQIANESEQIIFDQDF